MDIFVWDERYLTGEAQVDEEHRGLVRLINRVADAQALGSTDEIPLVLDELVHYAAVHFQHEETSMAAAGCDPRFVQAHVAVHRKFAEQVAQMYGNGVQHVSPDYLVRFLSSWLAYHILGLDQSMARQIYNIKAGMSAADAYEADLLRVADPVVSSLLQAMHALYGVVVQRNEQLQGVNDALEGKVRERTAELAESNLSLEQDIARRVEVEHALQARNAELSELNTRLSDMRLQLAQAEKLAAVGQLAAGVAHEINNPLSFVLSNLGSVDAYVKDLFRLLDAWEASADAPESVQRLSAKIDPGFLRLDAPVLIEESLAGLGRVKKIVQDLRDFSQVDRAQVWDWHDLNQCMELGLQHMLARLDARIQVHTAYADLPKVWCCASHIHLLLSNILQNALEAMPEGGEIRVSSGLDEDFAWLRVEDSGHGIALENLPRVFEPFYTTKAVGDGTGMGLAQAWGIAQQHRGRIDVSSTPGQGTSVQLSLPIKRPIEAEVLA